MTNLIDENRAGRSSLPFVLAVAALAGLLLTAWAVSTLFLARQADREAQGHAQTLMRSEIERLEERMDAIALQTARSPEFLAASLDGDFASFSIYLSRNAFSKGVDFFVAAIEGQPHKGWARDTGDEMRADLLPEAVIEGLRASRGGRSFVTPVQDYAAIDGTLWLLTALHPHAVPDAPLLILAVQIDGTMLGRIAGSMLLSGGRVAFDLDAVPANAARPFRDRLGKAVAAATWTPPAPGTDTIRNWLGAALLLIAAALLLTAGIAAFVLRMANELRRALAAAQEADRAKSVLLANVSHELRTPMNGILGAAQLFEIDALSDENRELVAIIGESAEIQLDLIESLLQSARLDAGEPMLHPLPTDILATIGSAIDISRVVAQQKRLELGVVASGDIPLAITDRAALRQIVINLVGNAVKFTEAGRVTVGLDWAQDGGAGTLTLRVEDTGIGFSDGDAERIFDRFAQLDDDSARRRYEGTGLGLSITRSLVEALGGRIAAQGRPGLGATFTVTLPMALAATAYPQQMASAA